MNTIHDDQLIQTETDSLENATAFTPFPDETEASGLPSGETMSTLPFPAEVATDHEIPRANSRPGGTFELYLREIGQVNLLTREEEIALADRIKCGDENAREEMIKANLRLVVRIARNYEGLGVPLLDLISEGNIGLMKAVERFDTSKGSKFSTYACLWIKQSILLALANQSKTIRLPVRVANTVALIRKAELTLRATLNRNATDQEIANHLQISPRRVRQYRDAARALVCLDSPIGNEDSTSLAEIVGDDNAAAPFDELIKDDDDNLVDEALSKLGSRKSKILRMCFGLDDGRSKTLEEVAEHFGLARERVRQLQKRALLEMRSRLEKRGRLRAAA